MGYTYYTTWIVCLDSDLWPTAKALQDKAKVTKQGPTEATQYPSLPSLPLSANSRITIVAHGEPNSKYLIGENIQWNAKECAAEVEKWLYGKRRPQRLVPTSDVKRISFHMCYGGKAATGTSDKSFAQEFASYCYFADEVVGRTGKVKVRLETVERYVDGKPTGEEFITGVPRLVDGKYKAKDRKVVFLTRGGTVTTPKAPTVKPDPPPLLAAAAAAR